MEEILWVTERHTCQYMPISSIPLLSKFFISLRKQNGTEYEPGTFGGFQRRFQRHLHEKGSLINILKGNEFERGTYCQTKEPGSARKRTLSKRHERAHWSRGKCTVWKWLVWCSGSEIITKGLCGGFFLSILARKLKMKAVGRLCWGDVGLASDPETDS